MKPQNKFKRVKVQIGKTGVGPVVVKKSQTGQPKFKDGITKTAKKIRMNTTQPKVKSSAIGTMKKGKEVRLQKNDRKRIKGHTVPMTPDLFEKKFATNVDIIVEGKRKAHYDMISRQKVMEIVSNYSSNGFKVSAKRSRKGDVWDRDPKFQSLCEQALYAKENGLDKLALTYAKKAFLHFNDLMASSRIMVESDIRDDAIKAVYTKALKEVAYRFNKKKKMFDGVVHVHTPNGKKIMESMIMASDRDTAARALEKAAYEKYGYRCNVEKVFVGSKKYTTIPEFSM